MTEAVVSVALETLRDLLLEEVTLLSGVSDQVKELQRELIDMKCLLEDADRRQFESRTVGNWISKIRDLTYRAEDAIETYAVRVSSNRGGGFKQFLRRFSCALNEGVTLHQIAAEISGIKSEIAGVTKEMQEYGIRSIILRETPTSTENRRWRRQTFPFEMEDCFVGKDDDLKRLVSLVVEDQQNRVISIWGMGGIGKTTTARKVYNHRDVRRSFESSAWVCVTHDCQIRSILEEVLKQLSDTDLVDEDGTKPSDTEFAEEDSTRPSDRELVKEGITKLSDRELIGELCQIQRDKRCLIVLDDIWEIEHWDGFKNAFNIQGLNSKVLLTTRKENVAKEAFVFKLEPLDDNGGWELLKKKVFPQNNVPAEELQKTGKEMVQKCGCLPLLISTLGGILRQKNSLEVSNLCLEWESVNKNIKRYLYRSESIEKENEIHDVLNLSYVELPYYLKPCFLYMGQFKENQVISTQDLYRLWIAQGMISHENQEMGETLMDTAKHYLDELASRCLVQVENSIPDEKNPSCQLHDVVRQLCLTQGKREGFRLQVMDYRGGNFATELKKSFVGIITRHLAIHFEKEIEVARDGCTIPDENATKHVRSLQFINDVPGKQIEFSHDIVDFHEFKLLRVLIFMKFSFAGRKLPKGISKLIHLRHLCLEECELDELPPSIGNLTYLITLNLHNSMNVRLPNVLKKMPRLKHLILPHFQRKRLGNYRLSLEGLDELETLIGFNSLVHDWKSVTRMKKLRHFSAKVHNNESLSAIMDAIKQNCESLRYCDLIIKNSWRLASTEEDRLVILQKVFECPGLRSLRLFANIEKVLQECEAQLVASRLVRLYLNGCQIEDDPMEKLGKIPSLKDLRLFQNSFTGEEMKCQAPGFPLLEKLVLEELPNLNRWSIEKEAMPLLSQITIDSCPHLGMIPDGLRFVAALQKLKIVGMPELGKRVSTSANGGGEGEDYDEVRHVPSIIIIRTFCVRNNSHNIEN